MWLTGKIKNFFQKKHYKKKKEVHSSFTNFISDYFTFNKTERNGTLFILSVTALITVALFYYRFRGSNEKPDTSTFQKQLDEFLASAVVREYGKDSVQNFIAEEMVTVSKPPAQFFVFDPNTATEEDFVNLGLSKKQAAGILNYRNKGGKFRKKEDFAKMYTISNDAYQRLEAFIVIPDEEKKENRFFAEQKTFPEKTIYEKKQTVLVEINTADSLELIKVKGIGPYIAMKIIELRTKLGGFYNKEQLREVYKIDSARYAEIEPFLTVDPFEVKQLNINTATIDELKIHPYIRYNLANSLVNIRQQHGNYKSVEDIKKSHLVTEDVFRKIAPYLTVD